MNSFSIADQFHEIHIIKKVRIFRKPIALTCLYIRISNDMFYFLGRHLQR